MIVQWNLSIVVTIGPEKVAVIERWPVYTGCTLYIDHFEIFQPCCYREVACQYSNIYVYADFTVQDVGSKQ